MTKIANIKAREVLDSRGNPTVEADVILHDHHVRRVRSGDDGVATSAGSRDSREPG